MKRHRASELLRRPVRFRDIRLGVPVDVLVDLEASRVVGFDVRCGDAVHRFLPLPACDVVEEAITAPSALVLIDDGFYRRRSQPFASLRGRPVRARGETFGLLADVLFDDGGFVRALVVETPAGEREVPLDGELVIGAEPLRPAV